jgi:uncharacterized protein
MPTDPLPAGKGPKPKPKSKWPWYRPVMRNWRRYYLRQFPRKKKLHGGFLHRILGNRLFDPGLWLPTRDTVALGVTVGTFVGFMPFFGLQIVVSLLLCFMLRVNVTAAVLATFISNPVTGPGILYAQYRIGKWLSSYIWNPLEPAELEKLTGVIKLWVVNGKPLMIGAVVTGVVASLVAYPLTLLLWSGLTKAAGKALASRQAKRHPHDPEPSSLESGSPRAAEGASFPSGSAFPEDPAGTR